MSSIRVSETLKNEWNWIMGEVDFNELPSTDIDYLYGQGKLILTFGSEQGRVEVESILQRAKEIHAELKYLLTN